MKWTNKATDAVIILGLLILSAALFVVFAVMQKNNNVPTAQILIDGQLTDTITLEKNNPHTIEPDGHVVLHIDESGRIGFQSSDCPDKICVNTGYIQHAGEIAVCAPNGIALRIVVPGTKDAGKSNESDQDLDLIVK